MNESEICVENLLHFVFFFSNSNDTFDIPNDKTVTLFSMLKMLCLLIPFVCMCVPPPTHNVTMKFCTSSRKNLERFQLKRNKTASMEWQQKHHHHQQQCSEPILALPSSRLLTIITISQAHNILPVEMKSNTPLQQNGMTTTKYTRRICRRKNKHTHTHGHSNRMVVQFWRCQSRTSELNYSLHRF